MGASQRLCCPQGQVGLEVEGGGVVQKKCSQTVNDSYFRSFVSHHRDLIAPAQTPSRRKWWGGAGGWQPLWRCGLLSQCRSSWPRWRLARSSERCTVRLTCNLTIMMRVNLWRLARVRHNHSSLPPSLPPSLRMRTLTPLTSATCMSRANVDSLSQLTPNQSWAGVMCACACACVRTCRNGTDTDCRSSTQHNLSHFWSLIWKGQSGACSPCIQAIFLPDNSHTHLLH